MVVAMQQKSVQCIVVGDGFVGKSSLIQKFVNGQFNQEYVATLKDDYNTKLSANGDTYRLNVSDIAGEHEDLSSLTTPDTYIVCFSLVDDDSMDSVLNFWVPKIKALGKHVPVVLVGTQEDLRKNGHSGHISTTEGLTLARTIGADVYVECSAKSGTGVQEIFHSAVMASIRQSKRKVNILKRVLGR
ncbi:rho-related GTP-binding protein RhoJ-like [Saccostrea cucullata]|uniref:rho-related GTP-binding protein RhoJ-like n=1 Tax=Saccostrea cuccullata TaxID=36930 RepID=UPI002ED0C482